MSRFAPPTIALTFCLLATRAVAAQDDEPGLRDLDVKPYGVAVRVPLTWRLVEREHNERAFLFALPQQVRERPAYVACELSVAPESLEEYRKRHEAADRRERERDQPRRTLIHNEIEPLGNVDAGAENARDDVRGKEDASEAHPDADAIAESGQRLVSIWKYEEGDGTTWLEMKARAIHGGMLFSFLLVASEAHFEAQRVDFEAMVQSARLTAPETGLEQLPDGRWLQTEFRFALHLPPEWKPAFGPRDQVLLFATGRAHEVFTDNLLVLASRRRALELAEIRTRLPEEIRKVDPNAEVTRCEIVPQGVGSALETVIRTERGPFQITILERRFAGRWRNYEVKFTCQTAEFERVEAELLKSLDSFREVPKNPPGGVL